MTRQHEDGERGGGDEASGAAHDLVASDVAGESDGPTADHDDAGTVADPSPGRDAHARSIAQSNPSELTEYRRFSQPDRPARVPQRRHSVVSDIFLSTVT